MNFVAQKSWSWSFAHCSRGDQTASAVGGSQEHRLLLRQWAASQQAMTRTTDLQPMRRVRGYCGLEEVRKNRDASGRGRKLRSSVRLVRRTPPRLEPILRCRRIDDTTGARMSRWTWLRLQETDRKLRGTVRTANGHHLEDELAEPRLVPTPTSCAPSGQRKDLNSQQRTRWKSEVCSVSRPQRRGKKQRRPSQSFGTGCD